MPEVTPIPPDTILLLETLDQGPITTDHIRKWTRTDPILSRVIHFVQSGWPSQVSQEFQPYFQRKF